MDLAGGDVLPIDVIVADRTKLLRLEASTSMGRRTTRLFLERVFARTSAEREARKAISWLDATVRIADVIVIVYDPARELTTFSFPRGEALRLVGRRFMIATWCAWFASRSQPGLGAQLIRELHAVRRLERCARRG